MPFKTRNPYYLRISEKTVLPLYLYLDERHLEWMSDAVLQHVLADLRPYILPKLKAEASIVPGNAASSKKATVDTYRGEAYQFCYFFRKTEPHSVVVKTRHFVALPPQKRPTMPPPPVPSSSKRQRGKRKSAVEKDKNGGARKKRRTKGKGKARDAEDDLLTSSNDEDDGDYNPAEPRRSRRTTKTSGAYQEIDGNEDPVVTMAAKSTSQGADIDMTDPSVSREMPGAELGSSHNMAVDIPVAAQDLPATSMSLELEIQEEEKPKPILRLQYQGFSIYGQCLCIVVEPWPPIRFMSRASSVIPAIFREPSVVPPVSLPTLGPSVREKTPLFLPDDYRGRSETPAPFRGQSLPPSTSSFLDPRFLEDSDESDDEGGMMQFSQVLNNAGDARAGAADDDEDMDTAMFFGDADEIREL
ncbi:hypothetical protein FPV67DRAFT_420291 [Lyophyllum atratum]|nr:hypothetical protein FPV67DRAFT_420291 [Lyophyllum atratum]